MPLFAQEVDDSGLGVKVGTTEAGDLPVGFVLGTLNDDFSFWMLWGRGGEDDARVQRWQLSLGTRGPTIALSSDAERVSLGEKVLAAPYMVIGGDRYRDLRLGMDLGSDALWNLLSYADVPQSRAYLGPLFGLGTEVLYPTPGIGGAATGSIHFEGGVSAGGVVSDVLHGRVVGTARFDPLASTVNRLDANALLALSFLRWGVPLGIQVSGEARQAMKDAFDPSWFLSGALFAVSRDHDGDTDTEDQGEKLDL